MLRALLNPVPSAIQNAPSLTSSFCAFLHISLLTFIALFNACTHAPTAHSKQCTLHRGEQAICDEDARPPKTPAPRNDYDDTNLSQDIT